MSEGLTMDKLNAMLDLVERAPPVPFLAMASILPPDRAIKFTVNGCDYIGAHSSFWAQVPRSLSVNPLADVPIHDLDAVGNEGKRHQFYDAMGKAMGVVTA